MLTIWNKLATIKLTVPYKNIDLGAEVLWENVKEEILTTEDGYLLH
ncbi:MAG: hypothetical protein F6K22_14625 [Okeania sp. SIO2F4]|nr:hypothetical protein [Okeania sp. SIO2F4]NES03960.1 hypothetical protein [Okeania sp. SIO2F4]